VSEILTRKSSPRHSTVPLRRWTRQWAQQLALRFINDPAYRLGVIRRGLGLLRTGRIRPDIGDQNSLQRPRGILTRLVLGRRGSNPAFVDEDGKTTPKLSPYSSWLKANIFTPAARADLQAALDLRIGQLPKISVLTPVYNTPPALLADLIQSLRSQVYDNWEVCFVDDASLDPIPRKMITQFAQSDSRCKFLWRETNGGISKSTNDAAEIAVGDVLVFVDHDDVITPDCLAEIALYYADHPHADIVYSDDDKITMNGERFAPQFKPDYSPTLLLSYMYFGHVMSVRSKLFAALGGFRSAFDGAQDFDFALRASECARDIGHIPKVLYSWRVAPGSTASGGNAKPASFERGRVAVQDALNRRAITAAAHHPDWAAAANCGIFSIVYPDSGPAVTLIIPTRNGIRHLRPCLTSLLVTAYSQFEVMVVDNGSDDAETLAFLEEVKSWPKFRVERILNDDRGFSFARLNNEAVRRASTPFVLLLNDDTEVITPNWLSQMMGHAQRDIVGAVGAKLLFSDGTIQHAGIVHGYYGGMAGPAFRNQSRDDWGYLNLIRCDRESSAVTGACMLVKRDLYLEMGGLDETCFNVAYNDVDFGYRLLDRGLSNVYCSDAILYHHEGKSRGFGDNPREIAAFRTLYQGRLDPYHNPNLSLDSEHFEVRGARMPGRNRRPVRIAMISHNLEHEGAPNSMLELASGLKARGLADPIILSPTDGPLRAHYEAAGLKVEIIRSPIDGIHTRSGFLATRKIFAAHLAQLNIEVVYGNTLQTFWAISSAAAFGLPAIWNPRESDPWESYFNYLAPELLPLAYAAFRQAYAVIFVAHATRKHWAPLESTHNFRVIPNGISMERLTARMGKWTRATSRTALGLTDRESAIVLVGTVCERKGQKDLLEATLHLSTELPVKIFIVGDRPSPYSDELHILHATLPAETRDRVKIIPETGDPYLYHCAADIAVCTSKIESYPRVVLEAMVNGLPIVTTPVFGIAEQVRPEVNALLYPPGDAKALALQLNRLLASPELLRSMGDASIHVLQGLMTYPEMLDAYGTVLREALLTSGAT
jgi:O-antigen biosynthesis protein